MPSAAELSALGTYLQNSGAGLMRGVRAANQAISPWQYLPALAQSVAPGSGVVQGNQDMRSAIEEGRAGNYGRAMALAGQGVLNTGMDFVPAMAAVPALRAVGPSDGAARMARAQEQGYTIDAYKGSPTRVGGPKTDWKGRVLEDAPWEDVTHFQHPEGKWSGFFSSDPEVASRFAGIHGKAANPGVFPTKLKMDNPLVIDGQGKPAAAWQFESIAREHGMQDQLAAFKGAFSPNSPYDGVIVKNTKDEGDVYIPRKPEQVRSRFAQFQDPTSKDLLAGLAALGIVGSAATGDQQ